MVGRARADGLSLVGPRGVLTGLTRTVVEAALEAGTDDRLGCPERGHGSPRDASDERDGARPETVLAEIGPVAVDVPRGRAGSFEPVLVKERQRRLNGVDQMVSSLAARGLASGEVSAHLEEVYGSKVSVSRIDVGIVASATSTSDAEPVETGVRPTSD
jgi:transposase-like protein